MQIDEWNIEKGNAKSLRDGIVYPPGCKVDGDGTIYVSATPGNPARTITPADLKAAEKLPGKVSIPVLVDCESSMLSYYYMYRFHKLSSFGTLFHIDLDDARRPNSRVIALLPWPGYHRPVRATVSAPRDQQRLRFCSNAA